MSIKVSALPTVTSVDNNDPLIVNASGVTSKILFSSLKTVLNFQPLNSNLTAISAVAPSAMGLSLLAATSPTTTSYLQGTQLGTVSSKTVTQVMSDLRTVGGVDQTTAQLLINKIINGITLAAATATTPDATSDTIDSPSDTYLLKITKVGYTGGSINFRFTKSTDVTFPSSGVLATVNRIEPTSDATQASAATLNLDSADGKQVDVTGTVGITAVTLAENSTRIVRFTGVTTLTAGASLLLPLDAPSITTAAGDFATFVGGAAGVVTVKDYTRSTGATVANINGGDVIGLNKFGIKNGNSYNLFVESAGLPMTAARTLEIEMQDGDRILQLGGNLFVNGTVAKLYAGVDSPEGVVTASVGSMYQRTNGGANTSFYVKESGSGNTGWIAK